MSKSFQAMMSSGVEGRLLVKKTSRKGFSLVELLIALFVFALISGFAYRSVNMLMTVTDTVSAEESDLSKLQRAFLLIERDIRNAFKIGDPASFPEGEVGFSLIMVDSVHEEMTASAKSVRYVLRNKALYRQAVFDEEAETLTTLLLNDVESMGFTAIASGDLSGGKMEVGHELLGGFQRHIMVLFQPAKNVTLFANLDTLEQILLMPTSVGGEVATLEDAVPVVLDEADIVADGW